ncbi:uncharacterized protein TM35_000831060 [Trypanosoma theileri]|uniref:Uncharacterized protein n=1 Tax=Trypanosoma theileri TaxID=67003 RepID=A0A1X0NEZ8_9TRYP|nr:uncharacterized protein TM35_000831060 [Trypanosoma theileri]ORC82805.1 hypothetical protein TM35_000831060 [Trypanosoma theileri]
MTTMFVQLRRVVYLLVLLHFCTSSVYANAQMDVLSRREREAVVNQEDALGLFLDVPNYSLDELKQDDVLNKVDQLPLTVHHLLLAVKDSEIHYKNGTACKAEWERVVATNEKTVREAEAATKEINDLLAKVTKIKEDEKAKVVDTKNTRAQEFNEVLEKIRSVLKKYKDKAPNGETVFEIAKAHQAELLCSAIRSNVDHVLGRLKDKLKLLGYYAEQEYNTSERAMRVKKIGELVRDTLQNVTHLLGKVKVHDRFAVGKASDQVDAWKKAYEQLNDLENLAEERAIGGGSGEAITKKNAQVIEEIKKDIKKPKEDIDKVTQEGDGETKARKKKVYGEVNKNMTEAIKVATKSMEEEKKRIARERAKREEERRAAEDAARRAEEEKRRIARETQERIRREEEAKRAAEEAARRVEEEVKKRAQEEEEAKRVATEEAKKELARNTKKKKDNSVRPSLMHGPLLLLLLCVLGCTLVC